MQSGWRNRNNNRVTNGMKTFFMVLRVMTQNPVVCFPVLYKALYNKDAELDSSLKILQKFC